MKRTEIKVKTVKHIDFVDLTKVVNNTISNFEITEGMLNVFIPHTTAGVTINEAADPDVVYDLRFAFKRLSPKLREYIHKEGNSDAHFSSTLAGCSINVPIEDGKLMLGVWQGLYFCEFDGPRDRRAILTFTE